MEVFRLLGLGKPRSQHKRRDRWSEDGRSLTVSCAVCRCKLLTVRACGLADQRLLSAAAKAAWALHEREVA